ncbi:MAG: hypothetical protein IGBAC_1563 [Ignavibacteriae bacterium]|nr:MAG: hypothetical protein IGBAC_1563 [Ignavibacteriota bacterium]
MKLVKKIILILLLILNQKLFSQFIEQHFVLVIIDGARYSETLGDTTKQYTPVMHQLALQGAVIDTFINDSLTYTSRAIPAIWCGSWKAPRDTVINGNATQYATVPTFWEYFRKDRDKDSTDALYITKYFTAPWLPSFYPNYGPPYWPMFVMQENVWSDLYVWNLAKNKLAELHPKFSVIYLADVDAAGHSGNWDNYTRKITIADSIVGMLWNFLQSDSILKGRTTMVVTNDHGRHLDTVSTGFVGHGDGCWGCRRIQFLAVGSNIKKGITKIKRKIPDITPTIGKILNFNPIYSTGTTITEILKPIISFDKRNIDLGNVYVNSSKIDSFKIYNSGAADLNVNISTPANIVTNPTTTQILPHTYKNFIVTFSPIDTGEVNSFFLINHNDENQIDTIFIKATVLPALDTVTFKVEKGWNLISIPVKTEINHIDTIFSNHSSRAFKYSNGYQVTDTLELGTGYWLKFRDTSNVKFTGKAISSDTIDVVIGWNLIGMISYPVTASQILTIPENLVSSNIYSYNKSYIPVDTLYPGKAYWIKVNTNGKIILRKNELHRKN